jgi:lysozyme family protein
MKSNWQKSFELMLQSEGGFVNHPSDPGGRTNLGVTQGTWESWVGRPSDEAEMRSLTADKVEPLYKKKYWDAVRADELPSGIDYMVFDMGVNAGPGRSIKLLQTAVGTTPDGALGPITMKAVQAADPVELIEKFSFWKEQFYRSLDTFNVYS